jgi:hypothetical protein
MAAMTANGTKRTAYACRRMSVLWWKSGHAADITAKTDFEPICDISAQFLL